MKPCKCTHPVTTHLGGQGVCTAIGCACDGYVVAQRIVCPEAIALAEAICRTSTSREAIAAQLQLLIDARDSWQREAEKLLAQRDYADRRVTELEARNATIADQLRTAGGQLSDLGKQLQALTVKLEAAA
jgi:chromosome segregation ATPase